MPPILQKLMQKHKKYASYFQNSLLANNLTIFFEITFLKVEAWNYASAVY